MILKEPQYSQERRVSDLKLGLLAEAPFVPRLRVGSTGGVVGQTMLVSGERIYAPLVTGETEVFSKNFPQPVEPVEKIPYVVSDVQEIDAGRVVLGISQQTVVLDIQTPGAKSRLTENRYLVQTDSPGELVKAALLGETVTNGKKTQKVVLVTDNKAKYGPRNSLSVANLEIPSPEETPAQDLKTNIDVTGLWPVRSENDQPVVVVAYRKGEQGFVGVIGSGGDLLEKSVASDLYPLAVTVGKDNRLFAVTATGPIQGSIKTPAGQNPQIEFQKIFGFPTNISRVFSAGENRLLQVHNDGTVYLIDYKNNRIITKVTPAELTPDKLKSDFPDSRSVVHAHEALPTGPNEWTIFVSVDNLTRNEITGKSFTVSVR